MEPGMDRPQSALTRGVQITEFKDSRVNPEPVVLEETDILLEQFLSPRKLVRFYRTYLTISASISMQDCNVLTQVSKQPNKRPHWK